jgi:hypothetical protein
MKRELEGEDMKDQNEERHRRGEEGRQWKREQYERI